MSLWSKAPRQVYEVHGEDDFLSDDGLRPGDCIVRQIDGIAHEGEAEQGGNAPAHTCEPALSGGVHGRPGAPRLVGLALLATVTLGAAALVLFHVSDVPAGRHMVAERRAPSAATRHAFPEVPATAPPKVHAPRSSNRYARASTPPPARPRRRRKRIVGGHAEPQKTLPVEQGGDRPAALTSGEFGFER